MSWIKFHSISEEKASLAELGMREGKIALAKKLYLEAANNEEKALEYLDEKKQRTLGITAVSTVSLYYKAEDLEYAEKLVYKFLNNSTLPLFAIEQIKSLLESIWSENVRQESPIKFARTYVNVAIRGGEVVKGGAPLDLILNKVENIQNMFYRTTEFIERLPHRKRGAASAEIQELCRPWLFQAPPGSYQFSVVIQERTQQELFPTSKADSELISSTFLNILRATVEDPDKKLPEIVPDIEYRSTFLKLARSLSPGGKKFDEMEIKSNRDPKPVVIYTISKKNINDSIKKQFPKRIDEGISETLNGVLRAVHLDKDWIEISTEKEHIKITEIGETVDDVIGPMVNKNVIVQTVKKPNGLYILNDIQLEE